MKIAFIAGTKAYLPERYAYQDFFKEQGHELDIYSAIRAIDKEVDYDFIWIMMGTHFGSLSQFKNVIHEYQSIPIDKSNFKAGAKGWIKKKFTALPNLRIFKNQAVKAYFNFQDDIPFLYRDMGIKKCFLTQDIVPKIYDFVYVGEISEDRNFDQVINVFANKLDAYSLLLIGKIPAYYSKAINSRKNIHAIGNIEYYKVPSFLSQCKYGLHYVPNRFPFNLQLSTKLLEYCATGLKVVTNRMDYIDDFEKEHQANFYKFADDFSDFNTKEFEEFKYQTPKLESFEWNQVISKSGILEKLLQLG